MKSAMQELMKWWDETPLDEIRLKFPAKATELLEKEKEQIKNSYLSGMKDTDEYNTVTDNCENPESYYNQTYKP